MLLIGSEQMKTTVEIPDELFRQVKAKAALEGIRLRDLVVRGLRLVVEQQPESTQFHRANFPLIRSQDPTREITDDDVAQALAEEDDLEMQNYAQSVRR